MLVYVIRNTVNGKCYGGKTERTFAQRWAKHLYDARRGSKYALHGAIRKHGPEAFQLVMECKVDSLDLLSPAEMAFIESFNCMVPHGYNLTRGGDGCSGYKWTEAQRRNLSEVRKNTPISQEQLRRLHETFKGKPLSKEHRRKIGEKCRGDRSSNAKLTDAQVRDIREEYAFSGGSQTALARKYGVDRATVCRIVNYTERWFLREVA